MRISMKYLNTNIVFNKNPFDNTGHCVKVLQKIKKNAFLKIVRIKLKEYNETLDAYLLLQICT